MIKLSINLDAIDESIAYEGAKGRYIDILLIETPGNKFGNDYMAAQGVSKEARDAGEKGPILGNGKILGKDRDQSPAPREPRTRRTFVRGGPNADAPDEDVPY